MSTPKRPPLTRIEIGGPLAAVPVGGDEHGPEFVIFVPAKQMPPALAAFARWILLDVSRMGSRSNYVDELEKAVELGLMELRVVTYADLDYDPSIPYKVGTRSYYPTGLLLGIEGLGPCETCSAPETFVSCTDCGGNLCPGCALTINNEILCERCLAIRETLEKKINARKTKKEQET